MRPQIITENWQGQHNTAEDIARLEKTRGYQDLSTICLIPTRGVIPAKVVQSWMSLMTPMNQKFTRIFMSGMEVGEAYDNTIQMILDNPELSKWKYILTLEEDNMPPPDGLIKLLENMPEYDIVGGLYWTKGEAGQPMIYGAMGESGFLPQVPRFNEVQQCRGLGMGFTLFKLDIFKDTRLKRPWFKTEQQFTYGVGASAFTQDLYFFNKVSGLGLKIASDNRVKVGHYDINEDKVW